MRVKSHQPDPTTTTTDDDESGERSVILGWEEADIKPDDVYNDDGSSRGNNEDDSDDTSTSSGSSSELPIFVPPGHPSAPALSSNRPRPSPSRPHHHQPHSLSHPRHPPHHHTHHQHLRQPQSAGSRPIAGAALTPERPPRPPTAPRVRHQEAPSIIHAIPPFNDSFPTLSFSASTTTETSGLPTYNADYVAVLLRQIELLKVERKEADLTQAARLRSAEAQIRDLKEKNRQLRHENEVGYSD
ncbi:hypothetical protein DFS34DRAFT_200700 [Phlyctochytrium arcticum]|nr:hypothetical protein DFS34DRAFT_200700 [Phlyctochytrium arcticum]